jgi:hypothetical protein
MTFKEYIEDVKSQLECNEVEGRDGWVLYTYTNEQIDSNLEYFKYCFQKNLSSYKSLLFFYGNILSLEV